MYTHRDYSWIVPLIYLIIIVFAIFVFEYILTGGQKAKKVPLEGVVYYYIPPPLYFPQRQIYMVPTQEENRQIESAQAPVKKTYPPPPPSN